MSIQPLHLAQSNQKAAIIDMRGVWQLTGLYDDCHDAHEAHAGHCGSWYILMDNPDFPRYHD